MHVYLVQHGLAKSKDEDPERPLTDAGREEAERVARAAAAAGVEPAVILHSGKTRAEQTAEIFAAHLKPARGVEAADGLDPNDDPAVARDRLAGANEPALLVGHLPHLSRLAGLLLTDTAEREPIAFRNAGVVCLERGDGRYNVGWILTPELVAASGAATP